MGFRHCYRGPHKKVDISEIIKKVKDITFENKVGIQNFFRNYEGNPIYSLRLRLEILKSLMELRDETDFISPVAYSFEIERKLVKKVFGKIFPNSSLTSDEERKIYFGGRYVPHIVWYDQMHGISSDVLINVIGRVLTSDISSLEEAVLNELDQISHYRQKMEEKVSQINERYDTILNSMKSVEVNGDVEKTLEKRREEEISSAEYDFKPFISWQDFEPFEREY